MSRRSCRSISLPTLSVMTRFRAQLLASASALLCLPMVTWAQQASVTATATVQPLPLSLVAVRRTAVPGQLVVRIVGCGQGALTVDTRTPAGTIRTARHPIRPSSGCAARDVDIQLAEASTGTGEYLVSLDHSDRLLAPSVSQFVIPASAAWPRAQTSVAY